MSGHSAGNALPARATAKRSIHISPQRASSEGRVEQQQQAGDGGVTSVMRPVGCLDRDEPVHDGE
jgi:hypothetical protein